MSKPSQSSSVPLMRGRVTEFHEHRGLGVVETSSGERFMFHCIELTDESRRIDVGADVEFEIRSKYSRPEAFSLRRT